tara:strand:+ start:35187 stop:35441 length:255 start_codon:yes stop_codon:yes gene_type:complete
VEGRVEGFRSAVVGIWRRKRAAEAVEARVARVDIERCIVRCCGVDLAEVMMLMGCKSYRDAGYFVIRINVPPWKSLAIVTVLSL